MVTVSNVVLPESSSKGNQTDSFDYLGFLETRKKNAVTPSGKVEGSYIPSNSEVRALAIEFDLSYPELLRATSTERKKFFKDKVYPGFELV